MSAYILHCHTGLQRHEHFVQLKLYTRKKRGSLTATRPTAWGLLIAHCSQNEQRRSPRRYVYHTIGIPYICKIHLWLGDYTPMSIYRCHVLWLQLKFAKFQAVKNRASSKRLNHIWSPMPKCSSWASFPPPFAGFCYWKQSLPGFEHGSRLQIYTNILIYVNFSRKISEKYFYPT